MASNESEAISKSMNKLYGYSKSIPYKYYSISIKRL